MHRITFLFIVLFIVLACSSPEPEIVTVVVTATPPPGIITPTPTLSPTHTYTPVPTSTLIPTSTPSPTATPTLLPTHTATPTPIPTSTRVPTYTPRPISTPTPSQFNLGPWFNDCDGELFKFEVVLLSQGNLNFTNLYIIKLYNSKEVARTKTRLECKAEALTNLSIDFNDLYEVSYWAETDPEGEIFIGYEFE